MKLLKVLFTILEICVLFTLCLCRAPFVLAAIIFRLGEEEDGIKPEEKKSCEESYCIYYSK